ncbi:uncharacterized protein VTP21DRAFT_8525 [Calcarisporiella thermophila]|uniref:uncharacterized protein n=1 Tax=Calcarisporiella thermophila TaxID=911321 RepID=UPI0037439BF3
MSHHQANPFSNFIAAIKSRLALQGFQSPVINVDISEDEVVSKVNDLKESTAGWFGAQRAKLQESEAEANLRLVGGRVQDELTDANAWLIRHPQIGGRWLRERGPVKHMVGGLEQVPLSAMYAAAFAIYFLIMMVRIWRRRKATGVYLGAGTLEKIKWGQNGTHAEERTYEPPNTKQLDGLMRALDAINGYFVTILIAVVLLAVVETSGFLSRPVLHYLYFTLGVGALLNYESSMSEPDVFTLGRREVGTWAMLGVIVVAAGACMVAVLRSYVGGALGV